MRRVAWSAAVGNVYVYRAFVPLSISLSLYMAGWLAGFPVVRTSNSISPLWSVCPSVCLSDCLSSFPLYSIRERLVGARRWASLETALQCWWGETVSGFGRVSRGPPWRWRAMLVSAV
ncbi:hypothetical protein V8C42DRAFT_327382 [Trichoderma barbatum]